MPPKKMPPPSTPVKIGLNKRIKQGDATTSGLNSHLKSQHPTAWAKFKKAKAILERETLGAKRAIDECYDNLEGNLS